MSFRVRILLLCSSFVTPVLTVAAEPKVDARYPFRTDFANAEQPWYQLKPVEFPPYHSDHRVGGELVAADFLHRSGVLRTNGTGELVHFTLPPFGTVHYLNAPADLRDIPLGTGLLFFLHQDANGTFTKAATMQDDFTMTANHHAQYRLDGIHLSEGKLVVTRQKLPAKEAEPQSKEWRVNAETRVWKGEKQVPLSELAVGDELLANFTWNAPQQPRQCTDIWVGTDTHEATTKRQREKHAAFTKMRGLPAWISRVEGKQIVVDLLASDEPADRQDLSALITAEFPVGKPLKVAVANDELRSYWPPVDGKRADLIKIENTPGGVYGSGGLRLTLEPVLLLEGFRKGRTVRLFTEKWPIAEMPLGEGLQVEMTSSEVNELEPKEYPAQFPYRTDYGNTELPWYKLVDGEIPPRWSEHRVYGELIQVDTALKKGQFRADRTGAVVDFTLTNAGALVYVNTNKPDNTGPVRWDSMQASVMCLNVPSTLEDLSPGTRYCFHLYQDEKGEFTQASLISDEFSAMSVNKVKWRVEALRTAEGRMEVSRRLPPRKQMRLSGYDQPPDTGHAVLGVDGTTRVWKGGQQVGLAGLAVGDELLVNLSGETATTLSRCLDIWVGEETHAQVSETQRKKAEARLKTQAK